MDRKFFYKKMDAENKYFYSPVWANEEYYLPDMQDIAGEAEINS